MKVVHVTVALAPTDPLWGGAVNAAGQMAIALSRQSVGISLFSTTDDRSTTPDLDGVAVKLFRRSSLARVWAGYAPGLAQALDREVQNSDLVHIHELWHYPHYAAYRAAKRANKPYVVTPHGALRPPALAHRRFRKIVFTLLVQRRILRKATALHALTLQESDDARRFGLSVSTAVIPNGINLDEYLASPDDSVLTGRYPQIRGRRRIVFMGRIVRGKGVDILARAFLRLSHSREEVALLMAGPVSDGYRKELERVFQLGGVADRVAFTGLLTGEEKLAALKDSTVFVLPSYSEAFSMAVLEALACSLPVVISRQCNFLEVETAGAGRIIQPDVDALVRTLEDLLDNPALCQEMGQCSRLLVERSYTWDKVASQMVQLYEEVLREHGSTPSRR